ncbi:hypothetical protein AAEX63_07660 [Luteococcus sp. H138]|uniref:hypothetical protein n=1 Tax=unclassified Luteococcus TaxID=2639923 RepID=UPI00313D8283
MTALAAVGIVAALWLIAATLWLIDAPDPRQTAELVLANRETDRVHQPLHLAS